MIYMTVVYELRILFWPVFSFKELCLYGREVRDTVRYIDRSKLRLYVKKDRIDRSDGCGARKYVKRSDDCDNRAQNYYIRASWSCD
jgi:hypothetical protein